MREPWAGKLTPNQTLLVVRLLAEGAAEVTAAAHANCSAQAVSDVVRRYEPEIRSIGACRPEERRSALASLYRDMLLQWEAAGRDPAYQPEEPPPAMTLGGVLSTRKPRVPK